MAGKNSSSSQPQSNSIPINSNINFANPPEMNLDLVEFPLLNPSSSSAGTNPRSDFANGGVETGAGFRPLQQPQSLNWLKGINKPKEPAASIKLAFNETQQIDGTSAAVFDSGELKTHIHDCNSYVVGYFVGRRPSFPVVKDTLNAQWKTKGEFSMTIYGQQAFFFNFVLDEDRDRVLEMGSIYIENKLFLLRPWSPFLEQNIGALSSVPIWMNVTGIPFHLWNDLGFSRIASIVGKPVMTDSQTALKSRMSYARICVEVDADCAYPPVLPFYIDKVKYEARAEYPWKPKACSCCKRFGHSSAKCGLNPTSKLKTMWVPKAPATSDKLVGASEGATSASTLEHPTTQDQLHLAEKMVEDKAQPTEFLWTYAKKNKKSSNKNAIHKPVAASLLNPFDVLFQEAELLNQGLRNSGTKEDGSSDARDGSASMVPTETTKDDQVHEVRLDDPDKDDQADIINGNEASLEDSVGESKDGEIGAEKMKPIEEVSKYKPMDREKHIDSLMKLTGSFKVDREGRDSEVKNIFSGIADRFQPSKSDNKEIAKLTWDGVTNNEKLGRGMRTPIPVKKKI